MRIPPRRWLVASCTVLLLGACDPPSVGGAEKAEGQPQSEPAPKTDEAPEAKAETKAEAPAAADLEVDLARSKVGFFVAKATVGHEAKFERFSAKLGMSGDAPKTLSITLEMASLTTDQSALTRHLQSEDFFHIEKFPQAKFVASSLTPVPEPDETATHQVAGKLTIKDVTKDIEFPAVVKVADAEVTGTATIEIKAKDFGINYPGMAEELVDDEVELDVSLVFPRG